MREFISITFDYFQFETYTKIDIRKNEQDGNYPIVSFIFEERFKYKILDLYDIVNNISLFDKNGVHIDNIELHQDRLREYKFDKQHGFEAEHAEYIMNALNLSYKNLLDPNIFYLTLRNFNKYKTIIGHLIAEPEEILSDNDFSYAVSTTMPNKSFEVIIKL